MLLACLIAAPAKTGPEMNGRWSQNHPSLLIVADAEALIGEWRAHA
jgi:hypothetical protein